MLVRPAQPLNAPSPDVGEGAGERDAGQARAAEECPSSDRGEGVGERDAGQARAAAECALSDRSEGAGERDAGQALAAVECRPFDLGDGGRHPHLEFRSSHAPMLLGELVTSRHRKHRTPSVVPRPSTVSAWGSATVVRVLVCASLLAGPEAAAIAGWEQSLVLVVGQPGQGPQAFG